MTPHLRSHPTPETRTRVAATAALGALLLFSACSSRAPDAVATSRTPVATRGSSGIPASAEPDPCKLVPGARVQRITGVRMSRAVPVRRTRIVMPGMSPVRAAQCIYESSAKSGSIRGVRLRIATLPELLFQALGRIESSALHRLQPPPPPSLEAYWQSIGRTVWLRDHVWAISAEIVTDIESPRDLAMAQRIAVEALIAAPALP